MPARSFGFPRLGETTLLTGSRRGVDRSRDTSQAKTSFADPSTEFSTQIPLCGELISIKRMVLSIAMDEVPLKPRLVYAALLSAREGQRWINPGS